MKVQYYNIDGFAVSTKIRFFLNMFILQAINYWFRREHLTPAEIEENKTVFRKLITGAFSTHNPHKDASKAIRESILPPPKPRISWEQYLELPTNLVNLGRVRVEKTRLKHFNATVGMVFLLLILICPLCWIFLERGFSTFTWSFCWNFGSSCNP